MKKKLYLSVSLILLICFSMLGQKGVVHGKIVAFNQFPIAHAEISLKKSKDVVLSDSLGNFSIEVNVKDKLEINAKGFKTNTYKVKNHSDSIFVNLVFKSREKDIEIATGYGHMSMKDLNYAVTHLKSENKDYAVYDTIIDMIVAEVPGSRVDSNSISLLPSTSLNTGAASLIVVDGVPTDFSTVKTISVHNVKSINILKGNAAAIYGVRGINGVVEVTLKGSSNL